MSDPEIEAAARAWVPQPVRVYPNNDLIDHDTYGGECPCGPTPEPVFDADGAWGLDAASLLMVSEPSLFEG